MTSTDLDQLAEDIAAGWHAVPAGADRDTLLRAARGIADVVHDRLSYRYREEIVRLRSEVAMAPAADPTLTQHADGTVSMSWPDSDPPYALVSRDVLGDVVNRVNGAPAEVHRLTAACQQLTAELEQARADHLAGEQRVDWGVMADPERFSDGGRVWPCDDEQEARGWAASRPGGGLHVVRRRSVVGPWEQVNPDGTVTAPTAPAPRRVE
jgi:hypothetical protein